jgi:rhodanese-related sulfurtransferase
MPNLISLETLQSLLLANQSVRLLEILPRESFDAGHLPGAENLPLGGLDQTVRALVPDRDQLIVLYCSGPTCNNSHLAARRLTELGYRNVRVFAGGKATWRDAGLPLEMKPGARGAA